MYFGVAITKLRPQSYRKCVGRTEKACASKEANLTQLHQLCQEEWAKIHPTYCGTLVEGYLKHLTQVKQFKGNATKYELSVCKLLTHWEYDKKRNCEKLSLNVFG
jgi:hypothetical protein